MGAVFSGLNSAEEALVRAQRRVAGLGTGRLTDWLEAALPGMQRHFEAYQRSGDEAHLGELVLAHMNVGVVLDELMSRAANEGK